MTVRELNISTGEILEREYTPDELAALAPQPTPENPASVRLREIDAEGQLTPRAFRELVMLVAEGFRQSTGGVLDLRVIPGVAQVYAAETEAVGLRAQLGVDA